MEQSERDFFEEKFHHVHEKLDRTNSDINELKNDSTARFTKIELKLDGKSKELWGRFNAHEKECHEVRIKVEKNTDFVKSAKTGFITLFAGMITSIGAVLKLLFFGSGR